MRAGVIAAVKVVAPSSDPLAPSPGNTIMDQGHHLRHAAKVTYEISSGSEDELLRTASSETDSPFSSPDKVKAKRTQYVDLEESEDEEPMQEKTPPPRLSSAGHSLRQHKDLNQSLRAQENGDKPRKKRRLAEMRPQSTKQKNSAPVPKVRTERNEIRDYIATKTAGKRAKFFIEQKHLFLPLLPESNFIQRLVEQSSHEIKQAEDHTIPYEVLEQQPAGVKATMKPYQLLGLSFLVYMHRNGLSGILGDEMGLGKTLQTLSLIQYLKENRETTSSNQLRPSLIVCPLSVLSSWMTEARRWTPDLKVLRFHGPSHERDRLKRIAVGEIDHFGNETRGARKKKNERRTAKGEAVIDLDDDEEEVDERGVDIVVTTYDGFLAEQGWFKRAFIWNYVVLDEGHKIKNDLTLISKSLQGLGAEYRLILTGTPLQNNLLELWALLHWLYPEVFTDRTSELFKASFDLTKGQVNTDIMDHARRLLEVIMLRRMKNSPGVDLNLPPKTEVLLYVPLTPMQRFWYMRLLTRADQGLLNELFQGAASKEAALNEESKDPFNDEAVAKLEMLEKAANEGSAEAAAEWAESKDIMRQAIVREKEDSSSTSAWRKLMNILMQLRKCCNHPYILPNAEPDPYYLGEHIIHASAKFILLDKIINELVLKQKKKVLIFSGFTRMLDCCEDFLSLRGGNGEEFKYVRLDGRTSRARRNLGIRMFNQEATDYRVMLISTRAGGLGINLATASDVILLDQDWNPQIMLQAEARAHRIGQTRPVTVYKLCTQGTVEEQMMGRIQKKLYLSAKVTESMRDIHFNSASKKKGPGGRVVEADDDMPSLGTSELMSLVRRGAQTLAHPELDINEMMQWDWPTMLEKCKDRPADVQVASQTQPGTQVKEEDEKKWLAQIEQVQSRVFQGKKHVKAADANNYGGIAQEWAREARREGKNTTVMVDGYAVSKESMTCGDWEAVPTMAGKDPRLAEPKREKKPAVVNQEVCYTCKKVFDQCAKSQAAMSGLLGRWQFDPVFRLPKILPLHLS